MASCPKCGGPMVKKGKGTDHNLRVENRNVLKATHGKILVTRATRPLMLVCNRCGYIEFYVTGEFGKTIGKENRSRDSERATKDGGQYFT